MFRILMDLLRLVWTLAHIRLFEEQPVLPDAHVQNNTHKIRFKIRQALIVPWKTAKLLVFQMRGRYWLGFR